MDIEVQDEGRLRRIVLNRPEKRNALTLEMCKDIVAAVDGASGCVLLSANGPAFCAGMDLKEQVRSEEVLQAHEALFTMGARAKTPIVVYVNGAAMAGGMGLAAQGHIVLAAGDAVFALTEIRIGLWPFVIYRSIEAAVGRRRALQLSLTAEEFNAEQAEDWGLVHRVAPFTEAERIAMTLAKASPTAIQAGLQYVRESENKSIQEAGEIAVRIRAQVAASADYQEGVAAFREKREPRWPSLDVERR